MGSLTPGADADRHARTATKASHLAPAFGMRVLQHRFRTARPTLDPEDLPDRHRNSKAPLKTTPALHTLRDVPRPMGSLTRGAAIRPGLPLATGAPARWRSAVVLIRVLGRPKRSLRGQGRGTITSTRRTHSRTAPSNCRKCALNRTNCLTAPRSGGGWPQNDIISRRCVVRGDCVLAL